MQKFINNWSLLLSQSITPTDNTIIVDPITASKLLEDLENDDFYMLTLDDGEKIEIIKTTSINNTQITVLRGQENTEIASWNVGTKLEMRLTAQTLANFQVQTMNDSYFHARHITESIEGPGEIELVIDNPVYTINMGGPGKKQILLPSDLEVGLRIAFLVFGKNTQGSSISVEIGNGSVTWSENAPVFAPAVTIEFLLFTFDGGNQWYGRVLGNYP